jgi:hypothetical protein
VTRQVSPSAFDANGFSDKLPVLLAMLVYMTVFSGVGGWVTAVVSRTGQRDVRILAGLQFVMTLAANVMLFDRRLLWFYGVGLLLTPVAIVAGGRLRERGELRRVSPPPRSAESTWRGHSCLA